MSEQELNSILEEIKNRGKTTDDVPKTNDEEINFKFNSAENEEFVSVEDIADEVVEEPKLVEIKEELAQPVINEVDDSTAFDDEYEEINMDKSKKPEQSKNKKIIIAVVAVVAVIAIVIACIFGVNAMNKEKETTLPAITTQPQTEPTTEEVKPVGTINPLTGETGYSEKAVGKRPVAVVVENEYSTESVRPQWGLSDADIVLEGESEYSTRLLLFWADYNSIPSKVGPARSARPPFIKFSQLFDSIFIHAGLSHSKGNYVGADAVFKENKVAHVNLLNTSGNGVYFGRDKSRTRTIEHTGYFNGSNAEKLIKEKDFRRKYKPEKFTQLLFNEETTDLSTTSAKSLSFRWTGKGKGRCPKTGTYTYNEEKKAYTTTDFDSAYGKSNVAWTNVIFLLDKTEYVVKANYKGSGNSETYCNYALSGGKGLVASNGTAVEINWGVTNGKLWMKDTSGNDVKLNPGKTYIGYGSSNYGGSFTINE